jgi:hypothetical protein
VFHVEHSQIGKPHIPNELEGSLLANQAGFYKKYILIIYIRKMWFSPKENHSLDSFGLFHNPQALISTARMAPGRKDLRSSSPPHGFGDFGEFVEDGGAAKPEFVINRGISADDRTRGYVARNSALSSGDGAIADFAVSSDPNLSGENHVISDVGRTGKTYLGAQHRIFADA